MDVKDKQVFLRLGLIIFGRADELEKIRDSIPMLEKVGLIKKFVFHTFSSERLFVVKEHLLRKAMDGDIEPLKQAFEGKIDG